MNGTEQTPNLPPLPERMVGRPFGVDEAGRPLNRSTGSIVCSAVETMLEWVGQRAAAALPPETSAAQRAYQAEQARASALEQLVQRLNFAIADPNFYVTTEYLLNEGNRYSVEFDVFVSEICRQLSGDPRFHFHRGTKSIPAAIRRLGRPLPLRQVYNTLPRFAAKMADTDFRVVKATATAATIQWHAARDLAQLPPSLRRIFLDSGCQYIQGTFVHHPANPLRLAARADQGDPLPVER